MSASGVEHGYHCTKRPERKARGATSLTSMHTGGAYKRAPSNTPRAGRARRKRQKYSDCERRPWTQHDEELLRLHLQLFGCKWQLIATSMHALSGRAAQGAVRMQLEEVSRHECEARRGSNFSSKHSNSNHRATGPRKHVADRLAKINVCSAVDDDEADNHAFRALTTSAARSSPPP